MPFPFRPLKPPLLTLRSLIRHLSLRPPPPPLSKPTSPPKTPSPTSSKPTPTNPPTPTTLRPPFILTRTTLSVLFFLLSWYPAYSFVTNHVFCVMSVTGPSMAPFLNTDYDRSLESDWVWIDMRWGGLMDKSQGEEGLERGMVVAYRSPTHPSRLAVKRIIALPGDTVLPKPPYPANTRVDVPPNHVWVEGDQPDGNKTMDSNRLGPISQSLIVGRVGGVVWPLRKAGRIRWEDWGGSGRRVLVGEGKVEEYRLFRHG